MTNAAEAGGSWALHTTASLDEANLHLQALEQAGLLGITEINGAATVYLSARADDLPITGRWERVEERDWNAEWKASIRPIVVGAIQILAPWHPVAVDPGITLVIEPAQAFGTGHHETTTACLAALQRLDLQGKSVLDVGTGTGVLALAAKALGAADVVGVDTDPLAVEAANGNAQSNDLPLEIRLGSIDVVGRSFDVVVANLDTDTLSRLAVPLAAAITPGGLLIGSGVSNERVEQAVAALSGAGVDVTAQPGVEWALLRGTRTP